MTELLTEFMMVLILATGLLTLHKRSIHAMINSFSVQSICLASLTAIYGYQQHHAASYGVALLVLLSKGLIIPQVLHTVLNKTGLRKTNDPLVPSPVYTLLGGIAIAAAFALTFHISLPKVQLELLHIGLAILLLGLMVMINSRHAMGQIIGLYLLDNGIYCVTIATVFEMPMIVEMGTVFDLLIGLIALGTWVFRLKRTFSHVDIYKLRQLKG